jgi:hypothetical protein
MSIKKGNLRLVPKDPEKPVDARKKGGEVK